jgi:hypothetical protein
MSEYGKEKSLNEILQDLVTYCNLKSNSPVELKLIVPKNILGAYSLSMTPNPKITLFGSIDNPKMTIGKVYLNGGTVELES